MTDYFSKKYSDPKRWASYWHQIDEVLNFRPRSVLIIGKGDGLVGEYLRLRGIKITTLDIDSAVKPDVVASVAEMPFAENEFDVALCAQVLEHLSYENFVPALKEIKRVVKSGAVVSLPHFGPAVKFLLKIPFFPELKFVIKLPWPVRHRFKGEHYWEIGKRSYPLKRVKNDFGNSGFKIEKNFIVFENPLHRFFVLKK